ncbi:RNA polymerase sigma factor [Caulobacter sp. 73W]|uniref:RNA polymerase sigma factor n=1 Tax=Caulobacter sp. 73W TaxID=3161137 RepID=A0AB39KYE5_9CAUL
MSYLRDIDRWFIANVLPHERAYLSQALRFTSDREEAKELVQEAYARVLGMEAWRGLTAPRAYVLTVVRNLAVERLRRSRVVDIRHVAAFDAFDLADPDPDPQEQTLMRDRLRAVLRALETLPAKYRDILVMRRFQEMPPRGIADRLGISLSTLEKRLARGLELLAEAVDREPAPKASSEPARRRRRQS